MEDKRNINSKKRVVALLPMKANSERVKGKNFKNFGGKPLFKWVLDTLISIDLIDEVIINTDARDKLKNLGVTNDKVILRKRKKDICGDNISMNRVIEDDVNNVESDIYIMTHTTNPFLKKDSIIRSLNTYEDKVKDGYDSLFSVNKIQTRFYDIKTRPINHSSKILQNTQDLEPWFEENSNIYVFSKESFKKSKARIGLNPWMFETERSESIDIDTPQDWDLAEAILEGSKILNRL